MYMYTASGIALGLNVHFQRKQHGFAFTSCYDNNTFSFYVPGR